MLLDISMFLNCCDIWLITILYLFICLLELGIMCDRQLSTHDHVSRRHRNWTPYKLGTEKLFNGSTAEQTSGSLVLFIKKAIK